MVKLAQERAWKKDRSWRMGDGQALSSVPRQHVEDGMSYTIHDAKCVAETAAAILVESPDLEKSEWIPKSQLDDDSEIFRKGHTGTCMVTEWLAEQRNWL